MTDETKIVWVLGAGFSMPLGGPGLKQLLSPSSGADFEVRFPGSELSSKDAAAVRALYHYGCRYAFGRSEYAGRVLTNPNGGEYLWEHAEGFLDRLDAWASSEGEHTIHRVDRILRGISDLNVKHVDRDYLVRLNAMARRLVAAECSIFVLDGDVSSELWGPYAAWLEKLSDKDTIITFNYDRALETLGGNSRLLIPTPGEVNADEELSLPVVLKLHGSVDWMVSREGGRSITRVSREQRDNYFAIDGSAPAIATPGRSKLSWTQDFEPLWGAARTALESANHVIFVGYRFPPSDSVARSKLLSAIARNDNYDLMLHVVLGPNRADQDVVRLSAMLRYARKSNGDVRVHPLWSQDYFSIYAPDVVGAFFNE